MTRTPSLLLAASALSVFVLTGCGDGTVRTGAAATVGDERITTATLDAYLQRSLKDATAKQKYDADQTGFERDVLARIVDHDIIVAAAKAKGVTVTGADVDSYADNLDEQLQAQQGTTLAGAAAAAGIAEKDQREFFTDLVLKDALGDKLTESIEVPANVLKESYDSNIAQYDKVDSAHILVATKALADNILRQVKADPTQFATLAAKYSTDTGSKDKGGELGFQGKGALVKEFEAAIFGNPAGSFVEVHTQFGYHVIHVEQRRTITLAQATKSLRRNLLQDQRQKAIGDFLVKTAKDLGVHINPRFGNWDSATQTIVAAPSCPKTDFVSPSPRASDAAAPSASPDATPSCK